MFSPYRLDFCVLLVSIVICYSLYGLLYASLAMRESLSGDSLHVEFVLLFVADRAFGSDRLCMG